MVYPFSDHINRANFGEPRRRGGSEGEAESRVTGPLRFRKSEFLEEDRRAGDGGRGGKAGRCLASGEKEPKGSRTAAVFASLTFSLCDKFRTRGTFQVANFQSRERLPGYDGPDLPPGYQLRVRIARSPPHSSAPFGGCSCIFKGDSRARGSSSPDDRTEREKEADLCGRRRHGKVPEYSMSLGLASRGITR